MEEEIKLIIQIVQIIATITVMAIIQAAIRIMKTSQAQLEVVKAVKDLKRNGHGRKFHLKKMNHIQRKITKWHIIGVGVIIYGVQQNIMQQIAIH